MKCAACGAEVETAATECPSCGAAVVVYRSCEQCGYRLGPEDPSCPVCEARQAAGQTPLEPEVPAAATRKRARRLPKLPRLRFTRLGLLLVTLLALLAGGAVLMSALEGGAPASPPPKPAPTKAAEPTKPAPTKVASQGQPTPSAAFQSPLPPLARLVYSQPEMAGRWVGYMTLRRISPVGGTPQEQPSPAPQSESFGPKAILLELEAKAQGSGMLALSGLKSEEEEAPSGPAPQALDLDLDGGQVPYRYQSGQLTFELAPGAQFEGQSGRVDARPIIQGVWKITRTSPGGPAQLWEGTWTVGREPVGPSR